YQRTSGTPNGDYMSDIFIDSTLGPAVSGKQMFFGEFGCLPTDSTRSTLYPGINTLIQASSNNLGGCAWSLWDYSYDSQDPTQPDPAWSWGLYKITNWQTTITRTLRTDISTQFSSFVT